MDEGLIFRQTNLTLHPLAGDGDIETAVSDPEFDSIRFWLQSEDKFQSKLSPVGDYAFALFLVVTGISSLLGNGASLFIFYQRRKQWTPGEIFLVNLAIVDMLLCIVTYPCSMLSGFYHHWIFGSTGCTVYAFSCYFLGLSSLASLIAIAVIRYLKTCCPTIGDRIECKTSFKIVVWVYLFAFFWAVLPLVGFGRYEVEPFGLSCTLDWSASDTGSQLYISLVSLFCVFIPIGLMVFCYSKIVLLFRGSERLVGMNRTRRNISESQLTWTGFYVTAGFLLGWFPYTVVSLYGAFTSKLLLPMWATPFPALMAKSSCAYNPFIYIFGTARYRQDFLQLMRSLRLSKTVAHLVTRTDHSSAMCNTNTWSKSQENNMVTNGELKGCPYQNANGKGKERDGYSFLNPLNFVSGQPTPTQISSCSAVFYSGSERTQFEPEQEPVTAQLQGTVVMMANEDDQGPVIYL